MDLTFSQFLLISIASFRLTRLIVFDQITAFLRAFFFEEITEKDDTGKVDVYYAPKSGKIIGLIGKLLSCYWCTGIWIAIFLYIVTIFFSSLAWPVITILAIAGLASLLESVVQYLISEE